MEDAVMTNKTGTAMAPMKAIRELMGFDPFRRFPERFFEGFTLPGFVDTNKVNAEFKDGILRVMLSKREEAKPKQVEVKVK